MSTQESPETSDPDAYNFAVWSAGNSIKPIAPEIAGRSTSISGYLLGLSSILPTPDEVRAEMRPELREAYEKAMEI